MTSTTVDLIESFCSMHLSINLRKAFLNGIASSTSNGTSNERYHSVDTLVHEFCKLFGTSGVPEYGCGTSFADFLKIMSTDPSLTEEDLVYYQSCSKISLDRQVGSRYFVSAANAVKIIFLKEADVWFFRYTDR